MNAVVDFDVAPDGRRSVLIRGVAPTPLTRIIAALGGVAKIASAA